MEPLKFDPSSKILPMEILTILGNGRFQGYGYAKFIKAYASQTNPDLKFDRGSGVVSLHRKGKKDLQIQLYKELPEKKISKAQKWGQNIKKIFNKKYHGGLDDKIKDLAVDIANVG